MSEICPAGPGSQWLSDETGIVRNDQDGDDDQAGDSYSVRFLRADRPGAIIRRTAYPVNVGDDRVGQFLVRVETEWLVCRDPRDPGGTELWSDRYTYDEAESYLTAVEAEHASLNIASELLRDAASLIWDGLPQLGRGDV